MLVKLLRVFKPHLPLIIFCVVYIVFSFLTYKQYPISNGEDFRYARGKETLDHFLHGIFTEKMIQPKPTYFYFNAYPMLMVWLNPNYYFEWFHLLGSLFGLLIYIILYLLVYEATKNKTLSLFAVVLAILVPPFMGQIPINAIDMPFTIFYLMSLYVIFKFNGVNTNFRLIILGFVFGITQGMRQIGFSIYIVLGLYEIYLLILQGMGVKEIIKKIPGMAVNYLLIFIIANFFMLILWPNFAINYFKSMW